MMNQELLSIYIIIDHKPKVYERSGYNTFHVIC